MPKPKPERPTDPAERAAYDAAYRTLLQLGHVVALTVSSLLREHHGCDCAYCRGLVVRTAFTELMDNAEADRVEVECLSMFRLAWAIRKACHEQIAWADAVEAAAPTTPIDYTKPQ